MADHTRIAQLFERYFNGAATPEETTEFMACITDPQYAETIRELIGDAFAEHHEEIAFEPRRVDFVLGRIYHQGKAEVVAPVTRRLFSWPRMAAAASIVLCCSAAVYFYQHRKHQPATGNIAQNDIKPGTNGAILTLANGKKIILESAKNGKLAKENGSQVNKAGDSLLIYQPTAATAAITYNSLETPKGRQVEVELPDGSKVWLNAGSSLKYPTTFTGKERLVELTGEADFKVRPNAKMPFRVKTNGQITEDIGTEFNIDAYADEPGQRTTLLEGTIKVNGTLLKPGQQAVLAAGNLALTTANTAEVMAWKNGDFIFDNADIKTVMRQLARWYDVDVTYEGRSNTDRFDAQISKKQNIGVILNALQRTNGVRFKIEGRRVTVID